MSKSKPKKQIVFTIGGKGGVGKSWLVALLIDWYRAQGIAFQAFDLDNENNTLSRFYGADGEAEFIDVAKPQELDAMMEKIIQDDRPLTLIDMRAASTDRIQPWFERVDFDALRDDYGMRLTAIGVVDSSADSVSNIGFWVRDLLNGGKGFRFVIAQNEVKGQALTYGESKDRAEYQKTLDLAEIVLPKLEDWLHKELETAHLRVGVATELKDAKNPLTTFMNRSRLNHYQKLVFAEFDKIKDRLVP